MDTDDALRMVTTVRASIGAKLSIRDSAETFANGNRSSSADVKNGALVRLRQPLGGNEIRLFRLLHSKSASRDCANTKVVLAYAPRTFRLLPMDLVKHRS